MNAVLRRKWHDLLRALAVDPALADRTFEDICRYYAGPGRFYHTLDHVEAVLETVESLGSFARNLNAVKLAVWLHDVIYDSRASDNEERSADFADRLCEKLSIPEGRVVAYLILKTKTHDAGDDPDAQVLLDADLAILGSNESGLSGLCREDSPGICLGGGTRLSDGKAASLADLLDETEDFSSLGPSGRTGSQEHLCRDRSIGGCLTFRICVAVPCQLPSFLRKPKSCTTFSLLEGDRGVQTVWTAACKCRVVRAGTAIRRKRQRRRCDRVPIGPCPLEENRPIQIRQRSEAISARRLIVAEWRRKKVAVRRHRLLCGLIQWRQELI